MRLTPDAHTRILTKFQQSYRDTDDPFIAEAYETALEASLRRRDEGRAFHDRNARRDGFSLARKHKAMRPPLAPIGDLVDTVSCHRPNAEREAIFKDELRALIKLLEARSVSARAVLEHWAEDMSVEDTAEAMGLSVGRVKQLRRLVKKVALAGLQSPSTY